LPNNLRSCLRRIQIIIVHFLLIWITSKIQKKRLIIKAPYWSKFNNTLTLLRFLLNFNLFLIKYFAVKRLNNITFCWVHLMVNILMYLYARIQMILKTVHLLWSIFIWGAVSLCSGFPLTIWLKIIFERSFFYILMWFHWCSPHYLSSYNFLHLPLRSLSTSHRKCRTSSKFSFFILNILNFFF